MYCAGAVFSAARTGKAAETIEFVFFSKAARVFSVISRMASSSGLCTSSSSVISFGSKSVYLLKKKDKM